MTTFLDDKITLRVNNTLLAIIQELKNKHPEKYACNSDVVRVAVIKLHQEELPDSEIKLKCL